MSEEGDKDVTRNEARADADDAPDSLVKEEQEEPEDVTNLLTVLHAYNEDEQN